jgi:hypothetical protein
VDDTSECSPPGSFFGKNTKGLDIYPQFLNRNNHFKLNVLLLQPEYHMQAVHTEGEGYDRGSLRLPGVQEVMALQLARMTNTPLIVVLIHGGPLDVQALQESERVDAILTAWFPGQVRLSHSDCRLFCLSRLAKD